MLKNLEDREKGCNFALAFGNEAAENLEILNEVKKLNKNLVDSKIVLNFAAANGNPGCPRKLSTLKTITIDKSSTRASY